MVEELVVLKVGVLKFELIQDMYIVDFFVDHFTYF